MGEDWQPIETAPKDGTEILGFMGYDNYGEPEMRVIWWRRGWGDWIGDAVWGPDHDPETYEPISWMPLPAPPKPD